MDLGTYANIGHAYRYVEKIEQYGLDGEPAATLGLWLTHSAAEDEGTVQMLLEEQIDFDVVSRDSDLAAFETLVVPAKAGALDGSRDMIDAYLAGGGSMLVLGEGALTASADAMAIDVGAEFIGKGRFDMDYTVVGKDVAEDKIIQSPFLNYQSALRVKPHEGTAILATLHEPYFSRTYSRYCGHQNTPYRLTAAEHPAMVRKGDVIYATHGLDRMYFHNGAKVHRLMFAQALRLLHRHPMASAKLPSSGRISLLHQPEKSRYVLHLLYASPLKRGRCLVIEDLPELREVQIGLDLPVEIKSLTLIPDGGELAFEPSGSVCTAVIPSFSCHCAVVATY